MRIFDEINSLSKDELLDIDTYFDEMELTDKERAERKKFSREMEDLMMFIFALFLTMQNFGYMNKEYIISQLEIRYSEIVLNYIVLDDLLNDYIKRFSEEIVENTMKHPNEEYYLSDDRAIITAINEANTILGYGEFSKAKEKGYKWKEWETERDNKVRKTHREVDRVKIPINEPFVVGDSLMMYAHDGATFNAEIKELAGCRCATKYF